MTEDGPVAEVRDVPAGTTIGEHLDDDTFRVWSISSLDCIPREDHSRGKPCEPGQPCKRCQKAALTWWWEHGRRSKARTYTAASERAKARASTRYSTSDHGPSRNNREAAEGDAEVRGWPWVREYNGHGKTLSWIEVPRG
jgi:hypothetical protein